MKNRKKLLVLLMAALTALALTACNNNTPTPTPDNPGQEENQNPEQNQVTVDYTGDVTGWMYAPDTDDEITPWLIAIDSAEYGTSGASLKQANAAVSLMRLAMDESGNAEARLKTYLSGMNDTQRDSPHPPQTHARQAGRETHACNKRQQHAHHEIFLKIQLFLF